jgi:AcrR family transcriptional regulator
VKTPKSRPKVSRARAGKEAAPAEVSPRVARRERRRERSRAEIVEAARRVLLRDGIAGTTLDGVAREVGLTKAALYYYYPSKDALFFDVMYASIERQAHALHDGVARATDGGDALRAIVRETVKTFSSNLDDFRLAFLQPQVFGPGALEVGLGELARIRPLNDLAYQGAANMLAAEWKQKRGKANVDARVMVFLANVAALGILTMKGLVECFGDPLLYSDEELIEALGNVFAAAAKTST